MNPNFGRAAARSCIAIFVALSLSSFAVGCSSSDTADAGPAGGPLDGGPDLHCAADDGGLIIQPTSQASCHPDAGADAGAPTTDYGPTHDGTAAYDDDCKYRVSWTSTAIHEGSDATFTVTVTDLTTNQPATGAAVYVESLLTDTHPGDTGRSQTTESPPGTYAIGPVSFDASGTWTVRFHIFGECSDFNDDSPHGHAAFFVNVP